LFDLTGKTALVTGASGGIGAAIAQALHAQGATLILSGTRETALEELAAKLGGKVHHVRCNLSDSEEAEVLLEEAEKLAGPVDILVCNAGITKDNLSLRMKNEDFEDVINVNLFSTFILNRAAIKRMMKKKWGRIINISSVVAVTGNPGQANYSASKAGMIAMSKSLAAEVASRGITINCIAPGFIETAMTEVLPEEHKEKLVKNIPCGKMGQPEDIGNAAVFLASEESAYITGQTLHVNGGMVMI
jgi:3-oxoacyl-[acyl-carrier protein] reductase